MSRAHAISIGLGLVAGASHLSRVIGEGGLDRRVALKVLRPHLAHDERQRSIFLDEARVASRIATDERGRPLRVVHRDVKPGNVLIASLEIDLDLARLAQYGTAGWPYLPSLRRVRADVPPALDRLVFRGLAFSPGVVRGARGPARGHRGRVGGR